MASQLKELMHSRESTTGDGAAVVLVYDVIGSDNDIAVRDDVKAGTPATYDDLCRQAIHLEPIHVDEVAHYGRYLAMVRYGLHEPPKQTGEGSFIFDTTGGQQKITQSLATIASYAPAGKTAPDFKGAIGVTHDSVEGVEITVPVFAFSLTMYLPRTQFTSEYIETVKNLTGKVNSVDWSVTTDGVIWTVKAGECLFLGAQGSKRGTEDWEVTFKFAVSRNATGLTVGDITGIAKKGWEYLWVRYDDADDATANAIVKKPVAVYIEKVYEEADFAGLSLW